MKDPLLILAVLSAAFYLFGYYRMAFIYAGFMLQISYMLSRGIQLDRLPLVGPHDTLFFLSASTMLFALPVSYRIKSRQKFINAAVALSLFFILLSLLYKPQDFPLPPVLKTFWFEVHVAFSFFSYALFGVSAVLGILFFVDKAEDTTLPSEPSALGEKIEVLQYKMILVGYFLFSAAMIFGGIWAYYAWGTYWLWTPKELWTVILWLFYSIYLHARLMKWWTGRPSVIMGIAGFIVVMFTYLGVSLFMKSSHTF